jgi:hypothetical protein
MFPATRISGLQGCGGLLPAQYPRQDEAPGWLSVPPPLKNSSSRRLRVACRNRMDLERNSADAIAPAMTSSVPLAHRDAVGTCLKASPQPCGEELLCVRSRISQPQPQTRRRIRPTWPTYQPQRSPLPLRFSGEGPSVKCRSEDPKQPCGNGEYSRHLVDVKRKPLHMVFYSDSGRTERVTRPYPLCEL